MECMVELVDTTKAVAVIIKGEDGADKNYIDILMKITDYVITSAKDFCCDIKYDIFLLNSIKEADYFNKDNMFAQSDLDAIFACPQNKTTCVSVSGEKTSSRLLRIYEQMKIRKGLDKQERSHSQQPALGSGKLKHS